MFSVSLGIFCSSSFINRTLPWDILNIAGIVGKSIIMGTLFSTPSLRRYTHSEVSLNEYEQTRKPHWSFYDNYLYQSAVRENRQQGRMRVVQWKGNLNENNARIYFERLKMMGEYLINGNLYLPLLCIKEEEGECQQCQADSKQTSVNFYYESFDMKISDELQARYQYSQTFSQAQIWFILYCSINAIRQFQPFCEPSGCITLEQLMINTKGELRLRNSLSFVEETTTHPPRNYYSPEEIDIMRKYYRGEIVFSREIYRHFRVNPNVCQTYSLGLVILGLATFTEIAGFYDMVLLRLDAKYISQAISKFSALKYSSTLKNLMRVMLSGYGDRPLPSQIYLVFQPYEAQIMQFKPFSLSEARREDKAVTRLHI